MVTIHPVCGVLECAVYYGLFVARNDTHIAQWTLLAAFCSFVIKINVVVV